MAVLEGLENIREIVNSASTILLDIEGTTTSIDFVKKELFPYADRFIDKCVRNYWGSPEMTKILDLLLKEQAELEEIEGFIPLPPVPSDPFPDEYIKKVVAHLKWQMSKDCKTTGLKKIQGYIWMVGYREGDLKGHVYEDVPEVLKFWTSSGKKIFIYSSGSISSQELLFRNSVKGNLDVFIAGNFDTTIGSKLESESYLKIARAIHEKPENIVFFTDRPREIVAAKEAGYRVVRIEREITDSLIEERRFLGSEDGVLNSFLLLYML